MSLPPNCICPGFDNVNHTYFDRGVFDRQNCCFYTGCLAGKPEMFANEVNHVCCFNDCPTCYNQCMACYFPCCFGERVRLLPAQMVCCCCSTRACWIHNCCGLCGIKEQEPLPCYIVPVAMHLLMGEAARFVESYTRSRTEWSQRVGVDIAGYGGN